MKGTLSQGAGKIGTIMGLPVRVHFSRFIMFGLITWSLSTFSFSLAAPDLPAASYRVKDVLAAFLFFASVGFHELARSNDQARCTLRRAAHCPDNLREG